MRSTRRFRRGERLPVTAVLQPRARVQHRAPRSASSPSAGGWQRWFFTGDRARRERVHRLAAAHAAAAALLLRGLALILGGALGNLMRPRDARARRRLPAVPLRAAGHWPAFNVADSAITVGAVLLIFDSFRAAPRATRRRRPTVKRALMDVLLANPRGFCAGVDRAIAIVEHALAQHGAPIYVRHEVVHNKFVVDDLTRQGRGVRRGARRGARAARPSIFSAHGVSQGGARRGRGARPQRVRRDLPAGHQGARRGREDARAGPRDRDDRPRGPPRGRGHDGPVRRRHAPRRDRSTTSTRLAVRDPDAARLRHADHAVGRRRRGDRRRAEARAFRRSSARRRTTSATRRRTARTR